MAELLRVSVLRHPFRHSQICVGTSASAGMSGRPMRHSQHAPGAPPRRYGRYAVRPRLRAVASAIGQAVKVVMPWLQTNVVSQAAWHAPAQVVALEVQTFQVEEAAQLRRYLPAQVVAAEDQPCNAPVVVGGDALPFAEGSVAQPVVAFMPSLTVRCVVDGNQRFTVRFVGGRPSGGRRSRIGGSGRVP